MPGPVRRAFTDFIPPPGQIAGMSGDFSIETYPDRGLMKVRMWGFFSIDDVARYRDAIGRAGAVLGGSPADHLMVNDISDMNIQSQDVVAAFRGIVADPKYARRKVGFVAASTLARMQLSRIIGSRTARIFLCPVEAEAWLFEPDEDAPNVAAA